jgi:hypothetical protein
MTKNIKVVKPSLNSNCRRRSKHQKKPGKGALAHRKDQDSERTGLFNFNCFRLVHLIAYGWYTKDAVAVLA